MAKLSIELNGFAFDVRNPDEAVVIISEPTMGRELGSSISVPLKVLRQAMDQINKGWKGSRK